MPSVRRPWLVLGLVAAAVTTTAGVVAGLDKISESRYVPVLRGEVQRIAENLNTSQRIERDDNYRRWIDTYSNRLLEIELHEAAKTNWTLPERRVFEGRKRTLRGQINILEDKVKAK